MNIIFEMILLILLLIFAAVTAASEISIIAMSRIKLRKLVAGGSKTAKIILKILDMPEKFFGAILVTNNTVGALIAVLITAFMIRLFGNAGTWTITTATLITSFLIIVSEVTSKALAARYSERFSLFLARPIRTLITICAPVVNVLEVIVKMLIRLVGGNTDAKPSLVTEEEIRALIKMGVEEGVLQKDKLKMLSKVFEFSDAVVKNVMTPRKDMMAIDINANFEDIMERVIESGYSRIPVYKDSPESIIGVINMKDLLNMSCNRSLVVMHDIIFPAVFVDSSKKITELLKEFQKGHTHLAIVVDKSRKIEGIVTLEDLLEEIVGEIEDEYDVRSS